MTPDDVVSYNLRLARELRGWTQAEAAERISAHRGKPMSTPAYVDAERAHRTSRVKEFSVTELVALSRAFHLPLIWWFLPPDPWTTIAPRDVDKDAAAAMTGDAMLALLYPVDAQMIADLEARTEQLFSQFTHGVPQKDQPAAYLEYVRRQNAMLRTMLLSEFKAHQIDKAPAQLRELAERMDRALGLVATDIEHEGLPSPDQQGEGDQQ